MNKNIPCIALVGNAPVAQHEKLNAILETEELTELCDIILYGADGQPEQEALLDAIEDYRDKKIDGIVCLTMAKSLKKAFDSALSDEATKTIAIKTNATSRMASILGNITQEQAATTLKPEHIVEAATLLHKVLKRDLGIQNPRMAVLSVNDTVPEIEHSEEAVIITPAIKELAKNGIQAFGPYSSKGFFDNEGFKAFDIVVEIYETQCLKEFGEAANDGGPTMLAGTDIPVAQTDADNLTKALFMVADIIRNRTEHDRPFKNPLPKLYHERKEDGDKARFAVKKKGFNPAEHRRENISFPKMPKPTEQTKS